MSTCPLRDIFEHNGARQVETHARLKMTHQSDVFPALAGVAKGFARSFRCDYLAGLWRRSLIDELLCKHHGQHRASDSPMSKNIPTWSWASCDSPSNENLEVWTYYQLNPPEGRSKIAPATQIYAMPVRKWGKDQEERRESQSSRSAGGRRLTSTPSNATTQTLCNLDKDHATNLVPSPMV